jgi:serine/threonine-protein kinase
MFFGLVSRVRDLCDVVPDFPPAIAQVVARAAERDPEQRYASAEDFADALERAGASAGGLATAKRVGDFVTAVLGVSLEDRKNRIAAETFAQAEIDAPTASSVPLGRGTRKSARVRSLAIAAAAIAGVGATALAVTRPWRPRVPAGPSLAATVIVAEPAVPASGAPTAPSSTLASDPLAEPTASSPTKTGAPTRSKTPPARLPKFRQNPYAR